MGLCRLKAVAGEWNPASQVLDALNGVVVDPLRLHPDSRFHGERQHVPNPSGRSSGSSWPARLNKGVYTVGVATCLPPHDIQYNEIYNNVQKEN
jgi:hypothetical protein